MKHNLRLVLASVGCALLTLSISSCGGGGDGGGTSPPAATPTQTIVSGTVQAPGGQIAFFKKRNFEDLFTTEAFAALTGLTSVPDNTIVELARLNANVTGSTVIATTTTSGGQYSFNLTSLGLQPAHDLIVRVAGPGGKEMRAFVVGIKADLSPVSEAACQLAIQSLHGSPLSNLTLQEVADISGVVNVIATTQDIGLVTNLNQAVTMVQTAVQANAGATAFIAATASIGQTSQGPGDIGNHIPLTQGDFWSYQGTKTEIGGQSQNYQTTIKVNGTRALNLPTGPITTTVLSNSNPEGTGVAEDTYVVKDALGLTEHGNNDATDNLTSQLVPYRLVRFPLNPGAKFTQVQKLVDYGQDVDGDGRNESADVTAEVTVLTFEDVTVQAGAFTNAIKVQTLITATVITTLNGIRVTVTGIETLWLASRVGIVKRVAIIQGAGFTETITEELLGSLVAGSGTGAAAETRQLVLSTNDLIYDKVSGRIFASVPGNPGSVVSIDPATGTVGPSLEVGNQPNKLAISGDGQFLYVGLDGEASVRRVHVPTATAGLKFSLGTGSNEQTCGSLSAEDIEVLPGNPQSVAIAKRNSGCSPRHEGVAIFDDGIQRPNTTPFHTGSNQIEFSQSPTLLYGFDTESTEQGFRTMTVNALGVTITDLTTKVFQSNEIKFDGGRIYEMFGKVFDPVSKTIVGSLGPFGSIVGVCPDSSVGRVFSLVSPQAGRTAIQANEITTLQLVSSVEIEGNITPIGSRNSFIRWGPQGLAFRASSDRVIIVRSSVVQ